MTTYITTENGGENHNPAHTYVQYILKKQINTNNNKNQQ